MGTPYEQWKAEHPDYMVFARQFDELMLAAVRKLPEDTYGFTIRNWRDGGVDIQYTRDDLVSGKPLHGKVLFIRWDERSKL